MEPKTWRKEEGLTLDQLASKTGYGTSYLSEVENKKKEPSFKLAQKYFKLSDGKVNLLASHNIQ